MRDSHLHVLLGEVIAPGQVQLIQSAHQRRKKESMKPGHRNGLSVARTQSCQRKHKATDSLTISCVETLLLEAAPSAHLKLPSPLLTHSPALVCPQKVARRSEPKY